MLVFNLENSDATPIFFCHIVIDNELLLLLCRQYLGGNPCKQISILKIAECLRVSYAEYNNRSTHRFMEQVQDAYNEIRRKARARGEFASSPSISPVNDSEDIEDEEENGDSESDYNVSIFFFFFLISFCHVFVFVHHFCIVQFHCTQQ